MPAAQRIAFISPRFPEGATVGGAETLLRRLAERAAKAGREVTFLTTCARDHFTWKNELPEGDRRIGDMTVRFFPVDEDRDVAAFLAVQEVISRRGVCSPSDEILWLRNSVNSRALCRFLADHAAEYDRIVMGPYLFGLIWAVSQICPSRILLLPCLHDEGFAAVGEIKAMFHRVRDILFNSEPERELARRLYGLPEGKGRVVGMGLDPFEVSATAFAVRRTLAGPYVLYSGRREAGKGVPLLLDYLTVFRARTRRDVKLVFTGSGALELPPELRPHVLDAGFVSEQEKHEAMAGAAVFCHPSVNESLSIVLLESWLAGAPALVHARCAVTRHHCRTSGGGLWFGAYPEFEEELLLLLTDEPLRRAMGEAGRRYVRREYAWEVVEKKLWEALDRT